MKLVILQFGYPVLPPCLQIFSSTANETKILKTLYSWIDLKRKERLKNIKLTSKKDQNIGSLHFLPMQKYLNEIILLFLNPHGKHKFITVIYWVQELVNYSIFCDSIKKKSTSKIPSKFSMSKSLS